MVISTLHSQNNWLWKWKKLGYSNVYNIGSSGCLLTCYAMLFNMRPDDLNEKLKANGGYVQASLIVHAKAAQASGGKIKFNGFIKPYDNKKVLEQISKNGFCIVHLSKGSIPTHFVIFIGNKQMIDPINGKIEPTSKYGFNYTKALDLTCLV